MEEINQLLDSLLWRGSNVAGGFANVHGSVHCSVGPSVVAPRVTVCQAVDSTRVFSRSHTSQEQKYQFRELSLLSSIDL